MSHIEKVIKRGDVRHFKKLLRDIDVNDLPYKKRPLLMSVVISHNPNKLSVIEYLLNVGADIDYQNKNGDSSLYFAIAQGDTDTAKLLIKYGANLDALTDIKTTPLSTALAGNRIEIFKSLLDAGANPNIPNRYGVTLLHYAVVYNKIDIIELLLEAGADPNIRDDLGETPLDKLSDEYQNKDVNQQIRDLFESYLYTNKEPDY